MKNDIEKIANVLDSAADGLDAAYENSKKFFKKAMQNKTIWWFVDTLGETNCGLFAGVLMIAFIVGLEYSLFGSALVIAIFLAIKFVESRIRSFLFDKPDKKIQDSFDSAML